MKYIFLLTTAIVISTTIFAQQQTENDPDREFIYRGRQYIPHTPWWNVGFGYGYNFDEKKGEPNFMVDVHFRVKKKYYFGTGYLTSRSEFLDKYGDNFFLPHSYVKNSVNSLHFLYGWRIERLFRNFGFFLGPSYNWGYKFSYSDSTGDYHEAYIEPGFYASVQFSQKLYYDLGIGVTLWTSLNKSYQAAGFTLHFYFSTAFKRELK